MNRLVRGSLRSALLLALVVAAPACKGRAKPGEAVLPPAAGQGAAPRPALPPLVDTTTEKAVAGGETTGTTFPQARAEVGPPLTGVIADISVEEGQRVKRGQILFRLKTQDLSLRVEQARAAAASAEVGMSAAQVEFDRMQRLFDKKAIDQAQLDRARAQLDAAKAGGESAKVGVSMARQMMGDAIVRSPIDGVITAKLKNTGELATMMPPTVVVVVEDHAKLELRFRLPERALTQFKVGDVVDARFGSIDVSRAATIARIAPSIDPATRTVEVVGVIDNADGTLKSGMLATLALPEPPTKVAPIAEAPPATPSAAPAAATPSAPAASDPPPAAGKPTEAAATPAPAGRP
jgi:RND family efflux transporter MFP subunit